MPPWLAPLLAASGVAALLLLSRLRAPGWVLVVLGCAATLVLFRDEVRVYSYHGLMHASIVYAVLSHGIPPHDPFVAGGTLHYAWGHHALIALLVQSLDVTPPTAFALFNAASLAAFLILLHRVALALGASPQARLFGVALAVYGISPYFRGPLASLCPPPAELFALRKALPIEKFLHVNNNQAGLLCFAAFLLALLRLLEPGTRRAWRWACALFAAVLAVALLYPLLLPATGVCAVAAAVASWITGSRTGAAREIGALLSVSAAGALALPYLLLLQGGREVPGLGFVPSLRHLAFAGAGVLASLGPVAGLGLVFERELRTVYRRHRVACICVASAAIAPTALFLLAHTPLHAEYKLIGLATPGAGLLAGVALAALHRAHPAAAAVVLWLFLLPAASHVAELFSDRLGDPDRVREEGTVLDLRDPLERSLHEWIRHETPRDAVFIDSTLHIPVYAQRALWVPFPPRTPRSDLDGWGQWPDVLMLTSFGHSAQTLRSRRHTARGLLSGSPSRVPDADLDSLQRTIAGADAFVVARSADAAAGLTRDPRFERAFARPPLVVFRLVPQGSPSGG